MKVIVETNTVFGSGATTHVYIPESGVEYATDKELQKTMKSLWKADQKFYKNEIEDCGISENSAYIYAGDSTVTYEIVEVKTA